MLRTNVCGRADDERGKIQSRTGECSIAQETIERTIEQIVVERRKCSSGDLIVMCSCGLLLMLISGSCIRNIYIILTQTECRYSRPTSPTLITLDDIQ